MRGSAWRLWFSILLIALLTGDGCFYSVEQVNRDKLRYRHQKRGTAEFQITSQPDSLTAGTEASAQALQRYYWYAHSQGLAKPPPPPTPSRTARCVWYPGGAQAGHWVCESTEGRLGPAESTIIPERSPVEADLGAREEMGRPVNNSRAHKPDLATIWPNDMYLSHKRVETKRDKGRVEEMWDPKVDDVFLRALSSSASIAQMRDLLTEPSFVDMMPMSKSVELGCLPPPDSAAFTAVTELAGKVKASLPDKNTDISAEFSQKFSSAVVKLFEESERTVFLQYALFRLCELSINAPSEFKNVYPVIVHDIVRRTAEMNEWTESEKRRQEEEKTKQLQLQLEIKKADSGSAKAPQDSTDKTTTTPTQTPTQTPTKTATPTTTKTGTQTATATQTQTP